MRAEIQAVADDIKKSLALLEEASLTGRTATRRLAELNAQAEDQHLWDDPAGAQKLLRERTRLDQAIGSYRRNRARGRGGGRADRARRGPRAKPVVVADAEGGARAATPPRRLDVSSKVCFPARPTPTTAISRVHAGAGGTEGAGLVRDAAADVCALGPKPTTTRSNGSKKAAARKPGSNRPPSRFAAPTPMAGLKTERRRAPPRPHLAL